MTAFPTVLYLVILFVAVFLQCRGTSGIFANNTAGLLDKGQKVAGKSSGLEIQNCLTIII
jgi:hypothetical protein